eukprot:2195656-Rhodomonas_salina.1
MLSNGGRRSGLLVLRAVILAGPNLLRSLVLGSKCLLLGKPNTQDRTCQNAQHCTLRHPVLSRGTASKLRVSLADAQPARLAMASARRCA